MAEIKIAFHCPPVQQKKARYVIDLFSSITGLKFVSTDKSPDIIYGDGSSGAALIIPCIDYSINDGDWLLLEGKSRLVVPSFIQADALASELSPLPLDILALMFKFLEAGLKKDGASMWSPDRFKTNLCYTYPFFVSYAEYLLRALKKSGLIASEFQVKSPWPGEAVFAVGLSHDLDIFKRRLPGSVIMLIKSLIPGLLPGGIAGSLRGLFDSALSILPGRTNPYCGFERWPDMEGISTLFVYQGRNRTSKDPTYEAAAVARKIAGLPGTQFEIGLHNGIGTSSKAQLLKESRDELAEKFGAGVRGIRPHYLDCRFPEFWRNAGDFDYSSSVGSDRICGFAGGLNFPFFGVDFDSGERLSMLELPIGVMDCALFTISDPQIRQRTIDQILQVSAATHGLLVLDWHTMTAYEPDFPGWFAAYKSILARVKELGAYIAPLGEIERHWRGHCESVFLS